MRLMILASSLLLCACAANGARPTGQNWSSAGYQGFAASIDSFVGPAIDCGFFNLLVDKPASAVRRQARACVERAIAAGLPFKYGTERLPIDSYATEVIARTPDGKLWMIVFDVMIDGDAPQQWNQVCRTVAVDTRTMIINAQGCEEQSSGRLVTP